MSTRVLIADDHPLFRQGLADVLAQLDGLELVAAVGTGAEAVECARKLKPDVVVMDLHMPDVDGIEATRMILAEHAETAVLVLTMFDDDASVLAAMRAGARGYLLKGAEQAQIARAIAAVADGEAIIGATLAQRLGGFMDAAERSRRPFPELTDREREVLDLVAAGCSNHTIAARLGLTPKTVRNNVSAILNKLEVPSRAEAILLAREAGLGR